MLKNRKDIQRNVFKLNLSKSTTIKVPVDTTGNLGGLYEAFGEDPRYFRIVNLADPVFQFRTVHFQIDSEYIDSFQQVLNAVSVNFRKKYGDKHPDFTPDPLIFTHESVQQGQTIQEVSFPRLGIKSEAWTEYEYQLRWSIRNGPTIRVPLETDRWLSSKDGVVSLVSPFQKREVEIDADRQFFVERNIASAVIDFATTLVGEKRRLEKIILRALDSEAVRTVSIFHDQNQPAVFRTSWFSLKGTIKDPLQVLGSDYLYLIPPESKKESEAKSKK